ncbi:hypothetical protein D3C76_1648160 [compost metagenome]
MIEIDIAASGDLPQAGHAGVDAQAREVTVLVAIGVERGRPGADQAHVALEYIDQVGQLVEAAASEEPADCGDPRVLVDFEVDGIDTVLVQVAQ